VFLAAYRSLGSFDPDRSRFSTWLFTIARNKSLAAIRKKQVACLAELPDRPAGCGESDTLERAELNRALDRALASLPAAQRTAFVLAEFEDLPYDQIARIEGTRIGTVRSRISRAREKLRQVLHEYGEDL
jgi:RNA polymerase sigma-70 factor (ECF subfamily)